MDFSPQTWLKKYFFYDNSISLLRSVPQSFFLSPSYSQYQPGAWAPMGKSVPQSGRGLISSPSPISVSSHPAASKPWWGTAHSVRHSGLGFVAWTHSQPFLLCNFSTSPGPTWKTGTSSAFRSNNQPLVIAIFLRINLENRPRALPSGILWTSGTSFLFSPGVWVCVCVCMLGKWGEGGVPPLLQPCSQNSDLWLLHAKCIGFSHLEARERLFSRLSAQSHVSPESMSPE